MLFFFFLSFFSGSGKSKFACGRIYFYTQDTVATIEGHEVTPFLGLDFLNKLLGQNKTKGSTFFVPKSQN
jgi:hypothetical protein